MSALKMLISSSFGSGDIQKMSAETLSDICWGTEWPVVENHGSNPQPGMFWTFRVWLRRSCGPHLAATDQLAKELVMEAAPPPTAPSVPIGSPLAVVAWTCGNACMLFKLLTC